MDISDGSRPRELRYAVGATLLWWYLPLLVALFVGPVAQSGSPRAAWLRYFVVLPGMLAKSLVDTADDRGGLAAAGVATLVLLATVGILWARWQSRRVPLALVTLVLSTANAAVLASLFVM